MSWWDNIYYNLLSLPLKLLVKSEPIPSDPVNELGLDPEKKILYVLPYSSKVDLIVLRNCCKKFQFNDPLDYIDINGTKLPSFVFIDQSNQMIQFPRSKDNSISVFRHFLDFHRQYPDLDIQMVPVSILFDREPDKEGKKKLKLQSLNGLEKCWKVIQSGRGCFVRFSKAVPLRHIADNLGSDNVIAQKLARVARIHFSRQRQAAVGPQLPNRERMFQTLLVSPAIKQAIIEEAKTKNISVEKAEMQALSMLNEIAADFDFRVLRITNSVLTWAWSKLYQGLVVTNAEVIRSYAQDGYEIVYTPCHRSHMDYLLLSYVLYRQGLVPPHIAAGINLNFWPAGPIFRRLGAFFIRRTFKSNKLYTVIFREYLSDLFTRGYSVEYFVEGGRSRTGRLLSPKTGILSLTMQAYLRGDTQPIVIVPVYIGYEHIMEVGTYAKELKGMQKEKESFWLAMKAFFKLRNLGLGYVNFGQPIVLSSFLNATVPSWRDSINPVNVSRPNWLPGVVSVLSTDVMERINSAASISAMALCSTILLSAPQYALTREMMLEQLDFYLQFLKNVTYSDRVVVPTESADVLCQHIIDMGKMHVDKDNTGEIISITRKEAMIMTYYRNNIQHLLVLPALVVKIITSSRKATRAMIIQKIAIIYPLLKSELFLCFDETSLEVHLNEVIDELLNQSLITEVEKSIKANSNRIILLQLFAANVNEILQRYLITLSLVGKNPVISRGSLARQSQVVAERLSLLHGINAPEFFDMSLFSTLITTLRKHDYFNGDKDEIILKVKTLYAVLKPLIEPDIRQTINSIEEE